MAYWTKVVAGQEGDYVVNTCLGSPGFREVGGCQSRGIVLEVITKETITVIYCLCGRVREQREG